MRKLLIDGEIMKSGDKIYVAPNWHRIYAKSCTIKGAWCIAGFKWTEEMRPVSRYITRRKKNVAGFSSHNKQMVPKTKS